MKDGRLGVVYLLFEHKSYAEPLVAFHLLRYMVKIWELSLKWLGTDKLPAILPVVVYHGKSSWKIPLDFSGLIQCPAAFQLFIPDFHYQLCDLSRYSDEEIKGTVILQVGLLLLKHIFSDDLGNRLPEILALLKGLLKKGNGLQYLQTVLKYVASGSVPISDEEIEKAVTDNLKPKSCKRLFCRRYKAPGVQPYSILQTPGNAVDSAKEALPKGSTFWLKFQKI